VAGPAHPPAHSPSLSRRSLLRAGLTVGAAGAASPLLAACGGFGTSGAESGELVFLSTQFNPVEEGERFRAILAKVGKAQYVTADLAPYAPDRLEDLSGLAATLAGRGYSADLLNLAKFGTGRTYFIPWMQATYVLAVHKKALEHLPSGADVDKLTYDQFLAWAKAAKAKNGKPVFGIPAGPKGLLHRLFQGYLYPSFTGGQITTFRSDAAVRMWEYVRELWQYTVPASTNFAFMQEPLASGQVQVAWDHVARLSDAPAHAPGDFVMAPAPAGPKGRGYMPVVAGLAIPKGAKRQDEAKKLIEGLSRPDVQIEVLRKNAFFPAVKAGVPSDLPAGISLEAKAVTAQQQASDALLSLAPVGLGARDAEMGELYKNLFTSIVLDGKDIRRTLDAQAKNVQRILDEAKASCWAPDKGTPGQPCRVG
jgi:multiple sugar transport system substrate-binding protein